MEVPAIHGQMILKRRTQEGNKIHRPDNVQSSTKQTINDGLVDGTVQNTPVSKQGVGSSSANSGQQNGVQGNAYHNNAVREDLATHQENLSSTDVNSDNSLGTPEGFTPFFLSRLHKKKQKQKEKKALAKANASGTNSAPPSQNLGSRGNVCGKKRTFFIGI